MNDNTPTFAVIHTPGMAITGLGTDWGLIPGEVLRLDAEGKPWADSHLGEGAYGLTIDDLGAIAWGFADEAAMVAYLRVLDTGAARAWLRRNGYALEATEVRARCAHGFARATDGKCSRCDAPTQVTQEVLPLVAAKRVRVGVTDGGFLARRSCYAIAEAMDCTNTGLAGAQVRANIRSMGSERAITMLREAGYTVEMVAASEL